MDKLKMIQQIAAIGRELAELEVQRDRAVSLADLELANRLRQQIADRVSRKEQLTRQL
jgi:hypothetical protein